MSDEQRANINNAREGFAQTFRKAGVRAKTDLRDGYTLGYKFNDWEQRGTPLRLEIGPNDLAKKQTLAVRRDTGVKNPVPFSNIGSSISSILDRPSRHVRRREKDILGTTGPFYYQ
ncbi:anticodon-binding protein [Coprinopsis sp. MPI-PUGE-AT-0042]|nr:anticodon-binding protein [Coprinopsis sp. MPI-PUGE-AT-0042]